MKIIKEVTIKAAVKDTWSWLTEKETLNALLNSKAEFSHSKGLSRSPAGVSEMTVNPPWNLSIAGGDIAPNIITTFELIERGKHTGLKVIISGWEAVEPEIARLEMPRVSLVWEKKLGLLKKSFESKSATHIKSL